MAKSFQTGVAARNGVTAAVLARAGYRAAPDVFTGKHDMLRPFGGEAADASKLLPGLGEGFEICETTLKRHACCALSHAAVDAVLAIVRDEGLSFDAIDSIEAQLPNEAVPRIDRNRLWTHNIQYTLSLAAHEGRVGLEHYSREWTENPAITSLAEHVTVRGNDELQASFPAKVGAIVRLRTADREFVRRCDTPLGSPGEPLSAAELREKFVHLAGAVLAPPATASLWHVLTTMDLHLPVEPLFDALSTAGPASSMG
jgi:2-methylcitrate dehydratase PrpD